MKKQCILTVLLFACLCALLLAACDGGERESASEGAPSDTSSYPSESESESESASESESESESESAKPVPTESVLRFELNQAGDGYILVGYEFLMADTVIPTEHNGLPVLAIAEGAFKACSQLESVRFGHGSRVETIGESAFAGCYSLQTIDLPSTLTSIGGRAFEGCNRLAVTSYGGARYLGNEENPYLLLLKAESVTLTSCQVHEDTRLVDQSAFGSCSKLTSLTFEGESQVIFIGQNAFAGCSSLKEFTLPRGVKVLGGQAFRNCRQLVSVSIAADSALEVIGTGAFTGCSMLESLSIPKSVRSLGADAFKGCDKLLHTESEGAYYLTDDAGALTVLMGVKDRNLTEFTVPDSVRAIYQNAFAKCALLARVSFGEASGLQTLGCNAFAECTSLEVLTLPSDMCELGFGAFSGCSALRELTVPFAFTTQGATLSHFGALFGATSYLDQAAFIPEDLCRVTICGGRLGASAFYECVCLRDIILLDGVCEIGDFAFMGCAGITALNIPKTVEKIGNYAFLQCAALTAITVDAENTVYCAVDGCLIDKQKKELLKGFSSSVIPQDMGLVRIAPYAFYGCTGLQSVQIPRGVEVIGFAAFGGCSSLSELKLPSTLAEIDGSAFEGCHALVALSVPCGVTVIGESAFAGCTSLSSLVFEEGSMLREIGTHAFGDCTALVSVTIPGKVEKIGDGIFLGCTALTSLAVQEGNECYISIGDALIEIASKTLVQGCQSTVIADDGSVERIGRQAFYGMTPITRMEIPSSITAIGAEAFLGCTSLGEIVFDGSCDEWAQIDKFASSFDSTVFYTVRCTDGFAS